MLCEDRLIVAEGTDLESKDWLIDNYLIIKHPSPSTRSLFHWQG